MADYFSRLAERALGVAPVARPVIAPVFAPAPQVTVATVAPAREAAVRAREVPRPSPAVPSFPPEVETFEQRSEPPARRESVPRQVPSPAAAMIPVERAEQAMTKSVTPAAKIEPEIRVDEREPHDSTAPGVPIAAETVIPERFVHDERDAPVLPRRMEPIEPQPQPPLPIRQVAGEGPVAFPKTLPAEPAARRSPQTARRQEEAATPSTVQVTIGRIEVRAVFPDAPPPPRAPRVTDSALSLADYLKERDRGTR